MSRSYKKHKWFKCENDSTWKKIFNRRLRRSNKCKNIPQGSGYKKINCSDKICYYKIECSWANFKKRNFNYFKNEEEMYAYWKKYFGSK